MKDPVQRIEDSETISLSFSLSSLSSSLLLRSFETLEILEFRAYLILRERNSRGNLCVSLEIYTDSKSELSLTRVVSWTRLVLGDRVSFVSSRGEKCLRWAENWCFSYFSFWRKRNSRSRFIGKVFYVYVYFNLFITFSL